MGDVEDALDQCRTIAVVGMSRQPYKAAHSVPRYMKVSGYGVIPINPNAAATGIERILDEACYPALGELPRSMVESVEMVNVFRPSRDTPAVIREAFEMQDSGADNLKAIWLQLGIRVPHEDRGLIEEAHDRGLIMIENKCWLVEHGRVYH